MFWDIYYDYISLGLVSPLTIATYVIINQLLHPHSIFSAAIMLPCIASFVVWVVILISTPHQSWTPVVFALLLTIISVGGIVHDYASLRTPIYIAGMTIGIFAVSLCVVFLFLSTKGVERKEMGHMGKIVDGINVMMTFIGFIILVVTEAILALTAHLRIGLRKVVGTTDSSLPDTEASNATTRAQASYPPPYHVSDFYDSKV